MNGYRRTRGVLSGLCLAARLNLAVGCTLLPAAAMAQSVVNPTTLQFTSSPDHNTVTNGTPVVSGYTLSFYALGGGRVQRHCASAAQHFVEGVSGNDEDRQCAHVALMEGLRPRRIRLRCRPRS